jgi:diguanylate cyclase (GGDEF)-like protein
VDQAAVPDDEEARLAELYELAILDSDPEADFDDITELARRIAVTDLAIISLVDRDRQWFKSCAGASLAQTETPRSIAICSHTILQRDPLIIADTQADPRFADNPLVTGELGLRFYAGFPLISANGHALGSLCAMSRQPHDLSEEQIDSLRRLASLAMQHLTVVRRHSPVGGPSLKTRAETLLPSQSRTNLSSLDRLISRDQFLRMLELILAMEVSTPFALMRCRFRDYDRVNATLGALMAEEFMNEGARRVVASLPRGSSVARFADSELVVLLPFDMADQDIRHVAERIQAMTSQVYRSGKEILAMGVSIGIAVYRQNYDNVEAILADTSMALRTALRAAGSSYRFIDPETRVVARESYRLESDLRQAIESKALDAFLQPIVDLANGEPVGFEALARWDRGSEILPPSLFIPMLSESGITGELDLLIIEKALASVPLLALPIPQRTMTMSVNLSGILLEDPDLRRRLLALIDDNPLPPGWVLQVELLEDAFQDASVSFEQFLNQLFDRRVAIVIDDFGTGYSSLARLITLPLQGVKVDRIFVHRLDEPGESQRTLLRTMLSMLNDLGLSITAEGVETDSQRAWLQTNGVRQAQGYLFHRPLPISDAIELLQGLDYRPGALPVDPRRLRDVRRRRRRLPWRWPMFERRQRGG